MHPISVLELTKTEVDESSIFSDVLEMYGYVGEGCVAITGDCDGRRPAVPVLCIA